MRGPQPGERIERLYLSVVSTLFISFTLQCVVIVVGFLVVPRLHAGCQVDSVARYSVQVLPDNRVLRVVSERRLTVLEPAACRPAHRQRRQKIIPRLQRRLVLNFPSLLFTNKIGKWQRQNARKIEKKTTLASKII